MVVLSVILVDVVVGDLAVALVEKQDDHCTILQR